MRALLSVYDKTGLEDLARGLVDLGWELVSSGGTSRALAEAGIPVTPVEQVTGAPEMPGGRVKTLHPAIHGGILADRSVPEHLAWLADQGWATIDLVVCNLYPFTAEPSIEMIDVGGPTMVRAAAKNHASVGIVVDPSDYGAVLDELGQHAALSDATRLRLARAAFAHTAAYDAAIVAWLDGQDAAADGQPYPPTLHLTYERLPVELRYGENPHQKASAYRVAGAAPWYETATQHAGLALSYLNLYDADAAWLLAHDLGSLGDTPAVAIIKHANPCGAAVAPTLADAYRRAFECDERSAFGGIVATNRPIDAETVACMVAAAQADVVIAPGYEDGVIEALVAKRKNTRIIEAAAPVPDGWHLRPITGGLLVQEPHRFVAGRDTWKVVTARQPTDAELDDAAFAWRVCGQVKSNSIVLAKGGVAWGIGAGQQNRVEAGEIAAAKAAGRAAGGACASDAFYPFPDGIHAAADAGVAVIIQPGGSVSDEKTIAAADERGVAMIFTGERHFLH